MESQGTSSARTTPDRATKWIALGLTPGLGPTRSRRLVDHFGGVENVFRASLTELEACGLQAVSAQSIGTGKSMEMAQEEMIRATSAGAHIITLDDPQYPPTLKQIYDPPLALYVRGEIGVLSQPGIGVVGTRQPTPYSIRKVGRPKTDTSAPE